MSSVPAAAPTPRRAVGVACSISVAAGAFGTEFLPGRSGIGGARASRGADDGPVSDASADVTERDEL